MGYEIPQNLRYTEKIAFGLTFAQMAWLAVFALPGLVIFTKTLGPLK